MASDSLLGTSLALVDGDLVLEGDGFRMVSGLPNLVQALELRVLTPLGSDIFNITYGLDVTQAFTQPHGLRAVQDFLKVSLVQTISTDARVRDIREVIFEDDPDYQARHPEVTPEILRAHKRLRLWQAEVVIDTIANETATLIVNVGV